MVRHVVFAGILPQLLIEYTLLRMNCGNLRDYSIPVGIPTLDVFATVFRLKVELDFGVFRSVLLHVFFGG